MISVRSGDVDCGFEKYIYFCGLFLVQYAYIYDQFWKNLRNIASNGELCAYTKLF